ncbi:MAG: efflux RND transporter periplasmic adaptor subunit [Candidatus Thiodiazotropha weberae]|uniref:Efflux transporter periplasmic adaptor subunit n=1 Tax=Candidatus Thiodiazotropha endoloripes TaxID=1818881 RepID=A0A1E2UM52_9GAMM|nr:efflux RND transporter periplasmic adaptor subunit [Candidatus Thiodiazotropha endoloripes]MCG7899677.1 efflux RND transporter periplasmic adaptor subunit [Candidatus Thiodiazotropha weberae]MCG7904345.1 efflux RND transporter periplasmic adaptor subunit [Candidatus Thiodiazotropha weberae]ODB91486.1 efflux transporter periplasmic adaptor subunit [Candidatus Thiodiazotropha endoloripes]ODB93628.1 efflux transporter periplasmic adaptor subunit [Candidatus Thiodiazotropha endoloripes]ODB95833
MLKKVVLTIIGLAVLIGIPAAIKMQQFQAMADMQMTMPPEIVTADQVKRQQWPNTLSATGSLVAVQGVTVSAELGGKINQIAFKSGDRVKAGDLLVRLDTTAEEAQLRSAEAAAKLARINLDRNRGLRANKTVSQSDLDTSEATYKQATAQVENVKATIAKKTLRAPFSGQLGLRQVNLGQIIEQGTPVVTLQTIDPIYADFSLPQQRFSSVAVGNQVSITTDAAEDKSFSGKIIAINPEIDQATRTVRIRSTLSNQEELLRPGMFANVEVIMPQQDDVLAIPATSVLYAPYGDTVFVIDTTKDEATGEEQKTLRQQIIRLGQTRGDYVSVVTGLEEGETVVTSGVFKLRPNMAVVVDNTLALDAKLEPKPANE